MLPTTATPRPPITASLMIWGLAVSAVRKAFRRDRSIRAPFLAVKNSREDERVLEPLTAEDIEIIAAQLHRRPRGLSRRLSRDASLAEAYRRAHQAYLADRENLGDVPEIAGVSAGGMPDRVKCLHALAAHALAAGRGVNPLGDEALAELGQFWIPPCLEESS